MFEYCPEYVSELADQVQGIRFRSEILVSQVIIIILSKSRKY